jgi:hypothetical protein
MAGICALIELLDADGQVRQSHRVEHLPVRLGRALANEVVIDDPHVAPFHATLSGALSWVEGGVQLSVGSTVNGVQLGSQDRGGTSLGAGAALALKPGQIWRLGNTRVRVRLVDEALADELPLPPPPRGWVPLALMAGAVLAWPVAETWLGSAPGSDPMELLKSALQWTVIAGVWCGLWALGSTLFQRRFAFMTHLRIFVPLMLASSVLEFALAQLGFMLSWPALSRLNGGLSAVIAAVMIWRHLSALRPQRSLGFALGCATAFTVAVGINLQMHHKTHDRWFAQLYASTLSLPQLRAVSAQPVQALVDDLRSLEARLAELAQSDENDGDDAEGP